MTKKTRNFVLGAGGILAIGLTTGLVASLGLPAAMSQPAGPDELTYVPPTPRPSATPTCRR